MSISNVGVCKQVTFENGSHHHGKGQRVFLVAIDYKLKSLLVSLAISSSFSRSCLSLSDNMTSTS